MPDKTPSNLTPEVYHALIEVRQQRDDIKEIISEVKDFRIETHGRITKLETKAGILGFIGGLVGGALIAAAAQLILNYFVG